MQLPKIKDRKELRSFFMQVLDKDKEVGELDLNKKLKTYIIESNLGKINEIQDNPFFSMSKTSDDNLKILRTNVGGKFFAFHVDVSDERFWKLHSLYDSGDTFNVIEKLITKNFSKLDHVWLSSNLLERYMHLGKSTGFGIRFKNKLVEEEDEGKLKDLSMRFWGGGASDVISDFRKNDKLKQGISFSSIGLKHCVEGGFSKENISNVGGVTLMKGNSIDSHFNIVQSIKKSYSEKINLIESKYRFNIKKENSGIKLKGTPLYMDFNKPIEDLKKFSEVLMSGKMPFRIAGTKTILNKSQIRIKSIDLHTNDLVNFELTPNWMAIYLQDGSCGNVVARLTSNIQTHLTSEIKLVGEDNERII